MAESVTFTRRHFIAVANILAKNEASHEMIEEFSSMFKEDNPRFDKDRFISFIDRKKKELKEVM